MSQNNEQIIIPKNVSVFKDKKTSANTVAFPFQFLTGEHGILSITRLSPLPWKPSEDIETININFK